MFNAIHYGNYINYYISALNMYNSLFPFTTITYFRISPENSIYDGKQITPGTYTNVNDTLFAAGNYDIIGENSGLKFYQIYNFPVAFSEAMVPGWDKTDYGIRTGIETNFVFQSLGFIPNSFDFVSFNNSNETDQEIYQITQVDMTYYNYPIQFYKVFVKGSGFFLSQIEQQLVGEYGYVDFMNSIYEYDYYTNIINSVANLLSLSGYVNSCVDKFTQLRNVIWQQ